MSMPKQPTTSGGGKNFKIVKGSISRIEGNQRKRYAIGDTVVMTNRQADQFGRANLKSIEDPAKVKAAAEKASKG